MERIRRQHIDADGSVAPYRSVSIAASAVSTASVSQSWNHRNDLRTEDADPAKAIEAHSQRKGLATKTNVIATRWNLLQPVTIAAFRCF